MTRLLKWMGAGLIWVIVIGACLSFGSLSFGGFEKLLELLPSGWAAAIDVNIWGWVAFGLAAFVEPNIYFKNISDVFKSWKEDSKTLIKRGIARRKLQLIPLGQNPFNAIGNELLNYHRQLRVRLRALSDQHHNQTLTHEEEERNAADSAEVKELLHFYEDCFYDWFITNQPLLEVREFTYGTKRRFLALNFGYICCLASGFSAGFQLYGMIMGGHLTGGFIAWVVSVGWLPAVMAIFAGVGYALQMYRMFFAVVVNDRASQTFDILRRPTSWKQWIGAFVFLIFSLIVAATQSFAWQGPAQEGAERVFGICDGIFSTITCISVALMMIPTSFYEWLNSVKSINRFPSRREIGSYFRELCNSFSRRGWVYFLNPFYLAEKIVWHILNKLVFLMHGMSVGLNGDSVPKDSKFFLAIIITAITISPWVAIIITALVELTTDYHFINGHNHGTTLLEYVLLFITYLLKCAAVMVDFLACWLFGRTLQQSIDTYFADDDEVWLAQKKAWHSLTQTHNHEHGEGGYGMVGLEDLRPTPRWKVVKEIYDYQRSRAHEDQKTQLLQRVVVACQNNEDLVASHFNTDSFETRLQTHRHCAFNTDTNTWKFWDKVKCNPEYRETLNGMFGEGYAIDAPGEVEMDPMPAGHGHGH